MASAAHSATHAMTIPAGWGVKHGPIHPPPSGSVEEHPERPAERGSARHPCAFRQLSIARPQRSHESGWSRTIGQTQHFVKSVRNRYLSATLAALNFRGEIVIVRRGSEKRHCMAGATHPAPYGNKASIIVRCGRGISGAVSSNQPTRMLCNHPPNDSDPESSPHGAQPTVSGTLTKRYK